MEISESNFIESANGHAHDRDGSMNIVWGALPLALLGSGVVIGLYLMRRLEDRTGKAYLLFINPPGWTRAKHPTLFKLRLASYWIGISTFGLATLAFWAEFLGIA